jgi:ClpP class serine protease
MSFDFSSLIWIFIAIALLQAPLAARWYVVRRAQAIRAIEKLHWTRVITMIHRQEKRSLFGFAVSRHIDLEDAQTIIAAIKDTSEDMPIDFVIHTPGGLVLAAMQIARAVEAHKAKVTVYVPVYAMSGGTLIALAADEIVLGEFSVLGPIDPQIAGLPAASIVKARDSKPIEGVLRSDAGSRRCGGKSARPGQARGRRTVDVADGAVGSGGPCGKACGRTLDT